MKLPQIHLRDMFWLVLVVALIIGWFVERRHIVSELAALKRANAIAVRNQVNGLFQKTVLVNSAHTPESFITALRETKDWYVFADEIADAFAKTTIADDAIPELICLLNDPGTEVRTRAACSLGKIRRQADVVVPALIPVLEDNEPNVRWHAAFALRQFKGEAKAALPALMKQMNADSSPVSIECAEAVQTIDPDAVIEPTLIRFLKSDVADHRVRAAGFLSRHGTAAGKAALVAAYGRESDSTVKDYFATVIATIDARLTPDGDAGDSLTCPDH